MMISIIVPMYNAEKTIERCLAALCAQLDDRSELIVIDDGSSDRSLSLAKTFKATVLSNEVRRGVSFSRNRGAMVAQGDVLLFVDSDIVVASNALSLVRDAFSTGRYWGVTGVLSIDDLGLGFFSHYKNCYMNYILNKKVGSVGFLYGSICAIRKETPLRWNEALSKGEDTSLGQEMAANGLNVSVIPELRGDHYKSYSFISLIKNDFLIPFHFFTHFVDYLEMRKKKLLKGGFSHISLEQLIAISLVGGTLAVALLPLSLNAKFIVELLLILLWLVVNYRFFYFLLAHCPNHRLAAVFFTYLDQMTMGMGILMGAVTWVGKTIKARKSTDRRV